MNASTLFLEIKNYCETNASPDVVEKSHRYFKGGFSGYGLTTSQINQKVKELLKEKGLNLSIAMEAVSSYLIKGRFEEISCGLLLVNGLYKQFTRKTFDEIGALFQSGIDNWAHADVLGMYVLPKFMEQNIIDLTDFEAWIRSPHKFQRRCVPVTLIKSIKKDKDLLKHIYLIEPLMLDNEREVHQGVGWFLREAWKIRKDEVEAYLLQWKDTAPRLIIQYACEKMTPAEKEKYKKTKNKL